MSTGTYQYTDDGGRTYQIILPDDFATALGYQAANPADAYIPVGISPRFASYVTPGGRLFKEAVVTDPAVFASLPNPVTVDGDTYQLAAANGESFMQLPGGNLRVIAGPQGPQGEPGAADLPYLGNWMGGSVALNNTGTEFTLCTLSLPSGVHLVNAWATFQAGAAAGRFDARILRFDGNPFASSSVDVAGANDYANLAMTAVIPMVSGGDVSLRAMSSITSGFARPQNGQAVGFATGLLAVQIG